MKRLQYIIITAALALGISVCSLTALKAHAETIDSCKPEYMYTSVKVAYGDTLESIAREYNNTKYCSNSEYVSEIKRINGLYSDDIHAGCYLTVMYTVDDWAFFR